MFDLVYLLQHPIIKLAETRLAPLSHQIIAQRFTNSLYWDVHDSLLDDGSPPNLQTFRSLYGRLIEDYGRDLLKRIEVSDSRRRRLIWESDYQLPGEKTPDGLLLEKLGASFRCTLVEFTVGRPRLEDTVLVGDIESFQTDLSKKLGSAVNQQFDLLRRILEGKKLINSLQPEKVTKWLICVVVSDPYPSYETLISPLSVPLEEFRNKGFDVNGIFVLSLEELELIETLTHRSMVSQLLLDWKGSSYAGVPFKSYYDRRINTPKGRREPENQYLLTRMDQAMEEMRSNLFPDMP